MMTFASSDTQPLCMYPKTMMKQGWFVETQVLCMWQFRCRDIISQLQYVCPLSRYDHNHNTGRFTTPRQTDYIIGPREVPKKKSFHWNIDNFASYDIFKMRVFVLRNFWSKIWRVQTIPVFRVSFKNKLSKPHVYLYIYD